MKKRKKTQCVLVHALPGRETSENTAAITRLSSEIGRYVDHLENAQDRVEISLSEYERLKGENESLRNDNKYYIELLNSIEFPFDKQIVAGSVEHLTCTGYQMRSDITVHRLTFKTIEDF